ncbi:MAG: 2Fe-2S iron-sulfur cluster-binding protein, partial [Dysgonamonadaceae bacterium]|nr:2Fe-2S iron-sulfur cluster-binding protein [Dysgonamonadaceae bacterium]
MKHKVTLIKKDFREEVSVDDGTSLLNSIQNKVSDFYAPCGGNGTCGKCRVNIQGEGHVISCLYPVKSDITVFLPETKEMKVLASQYEFTKLVVLSPGESSKLATVPFGVAVDIGTTTMVFYIVNLLLGSVVDIVTRVNPQSLYGADVISRINYGHENPKHLANLQIPMIDAINSVVQEYCKRTDVLINDFVKISIVGNTTMLHNLLGVDAISIALAPFTPKFTSAQFVESHKLGIDINPKGTVVLS